LPRLLLTQLLELKGGALLELLEFLEFLVLLLMLMKWCWWWYWWCWCWWCEDQRGAAQNVQGLPWKATETQPHEEKGVAATLL